MYLAAGINPNSKCGIEEIDTFQAHLTDYQICEVSLDHLDSSICKGDKKDKEINLLYVNGHSDTIASMTGYFGVNKFCLKCKNRYGEYHLCSEKCKTCQDMGCKIIDVLPRKILCKECNIFVNEACFNSHKKLFIGKLSRCEVYCRFLQCYKFLMVKDIQKMNRIAICISVTVVNKWNQKIISVTCVLYHIRCNRVKIPLWYKL